MILFQNLSEKNMSFDVVYERIQRFIRNDPFGNYCLMLGTDSQVHSRETVFITGIVIRNQGKGVWACIRKTVVPRKMNNLHERISYETSLSEEIAMLFTEDHKNKLIDIILPNIYEGATFKFESHIDIGSGKRNKTSEYINEMMGRLEVYGWEPKIKPEAFVASSYANKFTK
jgi:hypothetical protein